MKPFIRNRILEVIRARNLVSFDELVAIFSPSEPSASARLRERRKIALAKNIQRARRLAMEDGETIHCIRTGGVTSYCMARLPSYQCDEQTMAELTLGRAGA